MASSLSRSTGIITPMSRSTARVFRTATELGRNPPSELFHKVTKHQQMALRMMATADQGACATSLQELEVKRNFIELQNKVALLEAKLEEKAMAKGLEHETKRVELEEQVNQEVFSHSLPPKEVETQAANLSALQAEVTMLNGDLEAERARQADLEAKIEEQLNVIESQTARGIDMEAQFIEQSKAISKIEALQEANEDLRYMLVEHREEIDLRILKQAEVETELEKVRHSQSSLLDAHAAKEAELEAQLVQQRAEFEAFKATQAERIAERELEIAEDISGKIAGLQSELQEAKQSRNELREAHAAKEAALEAKLEQQNMEIELIAGLQSELQKAKQSRNELLEAHAAKDAELEAKLAQQNTAIEAAAAKREAEITSDFSHRMSGLQKIYAQVSREKQSLNETLEAHVAKEAELEAALAQQKAEIEAYSAKENELEAQLTERSRTIEELVANDYKLEAQLAQQNEAHKAMTAEFEARLGEAFEAKHAELIAVREAEIAEEISEKFAELQAELAQQSEIIETQRSTIEAVEQGWQDLSFAKEVELEEKIVDLTQVVKNLTASKEALEAELERHTEEGFLATFNRKLFGKRRQAVEADAAKQARTEDKPAQQEAPASAAPKFWTFERETMMRDDLTKEQKAEVIIEKVQRADNEDSSQKDVIADAKLTEQAGSNAPAETSSDAPADTSFLTGLRGKMFGKRRHENVDDVVPDTMKHASDANPEVDLSKHAKVEAQPVEPEATPQATPQEKLQVVVSEAKKGGAVGKTQKAE